MAFEQRCDESWAASGVVQVAHKRTLKWRVVTRVVLACGLRPILGVGSACLAREPWESIFLLLVGSAAGWLVVATACLAWAFRCIRDWWPVPFAAVFFVVVIIVRIIEECSRQGELMMIIQAHSRGSNVIGGGASLLLAEWEALSSTLPPRQDVLGALPSVISKATYPRFFVTCLIIHIWKRYRKWRILMIQSSCLPLVGSIGPWRRRQGVLYLWQKRSLLVGIMSALKLQHRRVLIRVTYTLHTNHRTYRTWSMHMTRLIIWLIHTLIWVPFLWLTLLSCIASIRHRVQTRVVSKALIQEISLQNWRELGILYYIDLLINGALISILALLRSLLLVRRALLLHVLVCLLLQLLLLLLLNQLLDIRWDITGVAEAEWSYILLNQTEIVELLVV